MLMMGAKRKECYNEMSLPLVGYSANFIGSSREAYIIRMRLKYSLLNVAVP